MDKLILIIDDSLTVRGDLEDAFAAEDLPTISSATAAEARAVLAAREVGLIVLDVLLPDADGIDLLREIRAMPAHRDVPVLILSSEADVKGRIRGLMTGSNDYVGKPYEREYVVARARQLLAEGRAKDQAGEGSSASSFGSKTRVLLIDDSPTFRERFSELLRAQGFDVLTAESGEEGLRSAAVNRPAGLVVDGILPGIDGPTVIRKIRLDAALRDTPCILLTGAESRGAELRALDSGADAFVRKDEDLDMILARVTAVLRNAGNMRMERQTTSLHSPKKILAVDDSFTYLHELNDILSGEGYDVILAQSGEEALDMLAVQPVDCILLDRLMPGIGGTEACRRIKASSATRDIPLIMLTAMEDRDAMIEGLSTGADDYVLKSNELDVLKARVRAQLRRQQFEDESRRIRTELMNSELEAAEARAARELLESRAELLSILEQKNRDLEAANEQLRVRQREIADKNQQLEAASRLKSEFLSSMSHELRTPLNAIIGFSEVLKDEIFGELSPRQSKYITQVFDSGQHLLALINDILDLSKVEAGKMTLDLEQIELNELLRASLDVVMERALKNDIALTVTPLAGDDKIVVDPRKLRQIVFNLLSNAVKFSNKGDAVSLSASLVKRAHLDLPPPPGMAARILPLVASPFEDFLEIRISDTGIGMAAEDLPKLFQSFRQLSSSLTRQYEGTGLGLSLVYRLAELHMGTVGVASALQQGTQFVVWLPWRTSSDEPILEQSEEGWGEIAPSNPESSGSRQQALVIDDDLRAAMLLRIHLESIGFDVHCAYTAASALEMAAQFPPDLITLDLLLPDASGWEILNRLKANPQLATVPVVIISILSEEQKGFAQGVAKVLQKPVVRKTLHDAIHELGLGAQATPALTVLVIDDDPKTCSLVTAHLDGPGCKVLYAYDGRSAIETMEQIRPDLIILDLTLPDMDGVALLSTLQSMQNSEQIPILILTAKTLSQQERTSLQGRVLHIIEKGDFNRQQFLAEVNHALHLNPEIA